jgi:type IV pilus assembly protein PilC
MPEQNDMSGKARNSRNDDTARVTGGSQVHFDGEAATTIEEKSIFDKILDISFGKSRVPAKVITSFLRQLVMLLEAGVTLLRAITTLGSRVSNKVFSAVLKDVGESIEAGNTFWQSLARHPKHFNTLFVSIVRAGEASGTLTGIITRLADYREKKDLLAKQVRAAMIYPLVVLSVGVLILILFLVVVLPEFESIFTQFDIELPTITKVALATGRGLVNFWWLWIGIVAAIIAAFISYAKTPVGRLQVDLLKLKIPIFGQIITKRVVADFAHTFATLLSAGISILETLDLTKEAVGNVAFSQDLERVRESIERGEGLEKPLRQSKVVPPIVTDMLATGEESGSIDKISLQMAEIFEKEVESSVAMLKSLIEPILILFLGLIVLFLVLSFFIPYTSIINQVTSMG